MSGFLGYREISQDKRERIRPTFSLTVARPERIEEEEEEEEERGGGGWSASTT